MISTINKKNILTFSLIVIVLFLIQGCQENPLIKNKKEIPTIRIQRFDKALEAFDTLQFEESEKKIRSTYPQLFPFYVEELMGLGTIDTGEQYYKPYFNLFKAGEYQALFDSCNKLYNKMDDVEQELTTAFSHYHYYFPNRKIPQVYSMIISPNGNFPAAFTFGEQALGINLFCYLGESFTFYNGIYDNYWKKWLKKEYITRNCLLTTYSAFENTDRPSGELIYEMIEAGKKLYYLDCVAPDLSDEIKIGYTKEQLQWCKENEKEIWKFFTENKLLYSLDNTDIKRYTMEGPTTPGMPDASPGMVGTWIGWQIVKKYMDGNKNPNLNKLLYQTNAKEILQKAKYKP